MRRSEHCIASRNELLLSECIFFSIKKMLLCGETLKKPNAEKINNRSVRVERRVILENTGGVRRKKSSGEELRPFPHCWDHVKIGRIGDSFTQREGGQSQATDSSWDTGGCQFAGMAQNLPRSCAGQRINPPDWQLLWLRIRKRGRKSPAASSQSFLRTP